MKYVLILFFLLPFTLFSQDFSKEDYLFLKRHETIKIGLDGENWNIAKEVLEQAKYQTANKLFFANERMHYDSFTSIEDIDAYTILPNSETKVKVDYIETKKEFDNGIFYSDQESKNFTFPAVTKGAVTHLSYTEKIEDPHFLGMFRFGSFAPTKSAILKVEFPSNVTIGYIDFNTSDIPLQFKKEENGGKSVYTWTVENVDGFQGEEDSESALYYLPHIIVYIKNYELNGEKIDVLNDVSDLYGWYATLVDEIDNTELDKVYTLADNITKDKASPREKAETIFNWVQDNINYVAFEDGLGGFIPRGAASVCDKRYGDCKDMANVLYEMLSHVDIEAYRTWIGTRDRQYSYLEVPTPMVDNHMITTAIIENDTIFLDATDSYVPFGLPSEFTQTKEALLGIDQNTFKIIKVPAAKPEKSVTKVLSSMSLDQQSLAVNERRELTGYEKVEFVSKYIYKKGDRTPEEYLNTTLKLGNNKTNYSNIQMDNLDNQLNPLLLNYDLRISDYAKTIGDKVYLNLNIDKVLSTSNIDIASRKYSKKIDHNFIKEYNTVFNIPDGYEVSYLPEELSFDNPSFSYKIAYEVQGKSIIQNKKIIINTLRIENKDFKQWNAFIKSLLNAYKKSIILEKV